MMLQMKFVWTIVVIGMTFIYISKCFPVFSLTKYGNLLIQCHLEYDIY